MSEIEVKIDAKTKNICDMLDCLLEELKVAVRESNLGVSDKVADMVKDMAEAEHYIVDAMYKKQIMMAMEESEYGEDYDYKGKKYYSTRMMGDTPSTIWDEPNSNHKVTPYTRDRDMDRSKGRMYYTEPMSTNPKMGKSGMSRMKYYETKEMHPSGSMEDKNANMKSLEDFLNDVSKDITEMVSDMSHEEKNMLRNKMVAIANSVG